MEQEVNKSIKQDVLAAIQKGQVVMRPRWKFVVEAALLIGLLILLFVTSLFFSSFVFFAARLGGIWYTPSFGSEGYGVFFKSLPWLIILIFAIICVLLWFVAKKFSFMYHKPIAVSASVLVLIAVFGGYVLDTVHFHNAVMKGAAKGGPLFVKKFYNDYGFKRSERVFPGQIVQLIEPDFIMTTNNDNTSVRVLISNRTRLPQGADFSTGDFVVVFGQKQEDNITAKGVMKVPEIPDQFMIHNQFAPPQLIPAR